VPGPRKDWGDRKELVERKVRHIFGEHYRVEWEQVNDIPPLKSGKHLLTVCEIP
jgi:hypothetical protein